MSAGTGIMHSEKNAESVPTNLYQIWIIPREKGVKPRWDARTFPKTPVNDSLPLLVSGNEKDTAHGALFIHADAAIYGGRLAKGTTITQPLQALGYVLVSEGKITIDGQTLAKGDGAQIKDLKSLTITAQEEAELVLIDVAA
jgi:redox-sensitive bicupin YhaK (pirin superfamily)